MNAWAMGTAMWAALVALPVAGLAAEPADSFAGVAEVMESDLSEARGADNDSVIVTSKQDFDAIVQGNEFNVGNMTNGSVSIGKGAMENMSGIGVNVLNSGNGNGFSVGVGVSIYLH